MQASRNDFVHASVIESLESQAAGERLQDIKEGINNVVGVIKPLSEGDESVGDFVHVGVIGSTSFYDASGRSERICKAIGRKLAQRNTLLFTGGMEGIAESMGRAFSVEVQDGEHKQRAKGRVFHLLPAVGFGKWNYGVTIKAGKLMEDRRIILAKCAKVFVMVEGGPGTVHEATCAESNGSVVIPIFSTGGASAGQFGYNLATSKKHLEADELELLTSRSANPEDVADAVLKIIARLSNGALTREEEVSTLL